MAKVVQTDINTREASNIDLSVSNKCLLYKERLNQQHRLCFHNDQQQNA